MQHITWHKVKSRSRILAEIGKTCDIEGCNNPLTLMTGPGQNTKCAKHQQLDSRFGGPGVSGRDHTYHRKWVCDCCGKDVSVEVDNKFPGMKTDDPDLFNRLCRNRIIGDHTVRESDGGLDNAENIVSLCLECNADKTILNEDYRIGTLKANKAENNA